MADLSRRKLLITGGAVGAAALTTPLWTWPASASIARAGAGADPSTVWDPEADHVVADLIQHGDVDAVLRETLGDAAVDGMLIDGRYCRDVY